MRVSKSKTIIKDSGVSHTLASRDFVCHESPNHSRKRLTLLGVQPPNPP